MEHDGQRSGLALRPTKNSIDDESGAESATRVGMETKDAMITGLD